MTRLAIFFATIFLTTGIAAPPSLEQLRKEALEMVEARAKLTQEIVDSLFSFSELGYEEYASSDYLVNLLEQNGFTVRRDLAGMPTAFEATWGQGEPVVAFMADIDGLPETSQKPGVAWREEMIPGGPGHGEGHNAGQAVNVTAVLAVKDLMRKYGIPGTLRVYPGVAEELIGSRTYMVNAGLFKDVDVMFSSHISTDFNTGYGGPSGMGLVSTFYTFHGQSAHGAGAPWAGRSALDAVELMNAGWNYRREHIRPEHRSHYVITHGGNQPNVVPSEATVWYFFREWDFDRVNQLHAIGSKIAAAAAQMTDTTMTERVLAATWPGHFSKPIAEALYANIQAVGMPEWSEDDQALAKAAQRLMEKEETGLKTEVAKMREAGVGKGSGSDDIAEVSWNLPTVVLRYPGNIPGMIGHHWSSGIAMATPIAHKGSTAGAKAYALTALDYLMKPELRQAARDYFAEQTKEVQWRSLIPEGTKPAIEINKEKMDRYRPALRKLYYDPARYRTYLEQLGVDYPQLEK